MKKRYSFAALLSVVLFAKVNAQSVSINTDGTTAHASAMLEVKSTNKGLLIPRVALTGTDDAATISSPATSLLVYNTATTNGGNAVQPGFYYWNGSAWTNVLSGSAANGWGLTGNAGTSAGTNFIGTTDNVPLNFKVNNIAAGTINATTNNTGFGYNTLASITSGTANMAFGNYSLQNTTTGYYNMALGYYALPSNTSGYENVAIGRAALSGNSTGAFNTAVGNGTLSGGSNGSNGTAVGYGALSNNTASNNTAIGYYALNTNTAGSYDVALGYYALLNNTSGYFNTGLGNNALNKNTTGSNNAATGSYALFSNTAGDYNTAYGTNSLYSNTTATGNTGFGTFTLSSNATGTGNTATGYAALQNATGNNNTAVGYNSLLNNLAGSGNTAIGYGADVSAGSLANATAIGNGAVVNASNKIRLGNSSVTVIEGQVAYSFPSDARFKYNVKSNVPGLEFIKKLTPVTYYFDEEKLSVFSKTGMLESTMFASAAYKGEKQVHTGFLAQDVERIANELGYEFDGVHKPENNRDHYSLAYSQFIMPLVKAVQEQQQVIEKQSEDIEELKAKLDRLEKAISAGK